MTHHPASWLSDEAFIHFESEIYSPPKRFAVHLFGHMHEHSQTNIGKGGGSPRRNLQGASLFGLETFGQNSSRRSHGYSLGELNIQGGEATIRFKPRTAKRSPDGSWRFIPDYDNFKLEEGYGATYPEHIDLQGAATPVAISPAQMITQSTSDHISPSKVKYDPKNSAFLVPFRAKGKFMIGRAEALAKVREQLVSGLPTSIGQTVVFQGIGGLGKTQLAVEYAYHYKDSYPNGVYWLTANENIDAQLTRIAVEAHWIAPESEHATKLALARHRLKSYSDCLIVFDNLESVEAIQDYLPDPSASPHILVTSRREQPDFADVKLDLLDEDQSYKLLVQEAKTTPNDALEESAAHDIATALNGLPLALELAGAYLARRRISYAAYHDLLRANLKQALPSRLSSLTKHDADLFKTLSISESDISDEPLLVDVLDLLTWSGSSSMGLKLMAHLLDLQLTELYGALGLGEALRLLQKIPGSERYTVHRLVQEVRRQDRRLEQRKDWASGVARRMGTWFEDIRREFLELPAYEAEIEHLYVWQIHTESFSPLSSTRLLWLQAYPAYHRGRYKEASTIVHKALQAYEDHQLDDLALKANLLNDISSTASHINGARREDIKTSEEALAIQCKLFDKAHPDTAISLSNLAGYYAHLGDIDHAIKIGEQALAMRRELFGEKHPDIATSLSNLASYYYDNRDNRPRAIKIGEQALAMRRELFGEKHPDIATSLNNLATGYYGLGDKVGAFKFCEQALAMRRELFGEKHPDIATSLNNLANFYYNCGHGNSIRARELYEQALTMQRELLGESHPNSITALRSLINLLNTNLLYTKHKRALIEEFLEHIPPNHPSHRKVLDFLKPSRDEFPKPNKVMPHKKPKRWRRK